MLELTWPLFTFSVPIVFAAGGAWYKLHRIHKDISEMKPSVIKIPVIEVKVDRCEEDIRILKGVSSA